MLLLPLLLLLFGVVKCCAIWLSTGPFHINILHAKVRVTSQREFAAVCWKIIYTWMECKGHLFSMLVHAWRIYRFYYHPLDSIQCFLKFKMTLLIKYFTLVALQCVAVFYIYKSIHMQLMKGQVYCISACCRHANCWLMHCVSVYQVGVFIHSARAGLTMCIEKAGCRQFYCFCHFIYIN